MSDLLPIYKMHYDPINRVAIKPRPTKISGNWLLCTCGGRLISPKFPPFHNAKEPELLSDGTFLTTRGLKNEK